MLDEYLVGVLPKTELAKKYGFSTVYSLIAFKRQNIDRAIDEDYAIKEDEILKPCVSLPIYASNHGHIFNVYKKRIITNKHKYLTISWKQKTYLVHRLVAEAFLGESDLQVNHKDGNKYNNSVKNLEYCTAKENTQHSIEVLGNAVRGESNGSSKLTDKTVLAIYQEYQPRSSKFGICALAEKYNVDYTTVHLIIAGKTWTHITGGKKQCKQRKLTDEAVADIKKNCVKRGEKNMIYFCKKYGVSKPTLKKALES